MISRVVAAFLAWGLRKAGTPSEMASTPLRATAPEEKPSQQQEQADGAARLARSAFEPLRVERAPGRCRRSRSGTGRWPACRRG